MSIEKIEKQIHITTLILMMVLIFSMVYALDKRSNNLTECLPYNKTYEKARVEKIDDDTYRVFAVAHMWQFEPAQIYIPVGSEVDFFITSKDVVHGFHIADKNVNLMAVYGGVGKTTVKFDKPGTYKILCHEYCGAGHQNMEGEVIVNYPTKK